MCIRDRSQSVQSLGCQTRSKAFSTSGKSVPVNSRIRQLSLRNESADVPRSSQQEIRIVREPECRTVLGNPALAVVQKVRKPSTLL